MENYPIYANVRPTSKDPLERIATYMANIQDVLELQLIAQKNLVEAITSTSNELEVIGDRLAVLTAQEPDYSAIADAILEFRDSMQATGA